MSSALDILLSFDLVSVEEQHVLQFDGLEERWTRDGREKEGEGEPRLVTAQSFRDMTKSNVLFIAHIFRVLVILVRGLLMLLCVGNFMMLAESGYAGSIERGEKGEGGSFCSTYSP